MPTVEQFLQANNFWELHTLVPWDAIILSGLNSWSLIYDDLAGMYRIRRDFISFQELKSYCAKVFAKRPETPEQER